MPSYPPRYRAFRSLRTAGSGTHMVASAGSLAAISQRCGSSGHPAPILSPTVASEKIGLQQRRPCKHQSRDMISEEHTSELQSLMPITYAVFCLKQTTKQTQT